MFYVVYQRLNCIKQSVFAKISTATIFILALLGCKHVFTGSGEDIGYSLDKPDKVAELPAVLREISGITLIDSATIACIQDENGILFLYDIRQNKITEQYPFYENGDYEGICVAGSSIFVLRSDGALYEITDYRSGNSKVIPFPTTIEGSDNEGLCYDKRHNRLLIARKNKLAKGKAFKNKRVIYEFDLHSKLLKTDPVFEFDVDSIKKIASRENLELPVKNKRKDKSAEPRIRFASSEIAIHPITHQLFLLSSADHLLFIIDEKGKIAHIEKLNPDIFKQPEGMAFQKNGDMLITNEGRDKNSTLLQFKYQ